MKKLRLLKPTEIECRIGGTDKQTKANGKVSILLYIDSRCVTKYLDEHFGMYDWQTEFYSVNGLTIGKLGLWDEKKGCWIWKSDTGSESTIEAEKGLISDCYKRLLSRIGVTELYSAPQIYIDSNIAKYLKVKEIEYNEEERIITKLVLCDGFGNIQYEWSKENGEKTLNPQQKEPHYDNATILKEFCANKKKEENVNKDELLKFFNYYNSRIDGFKYKFNGEKLFESWMSKVN